MVVNRSVSVNRSVPADIVLPHVYYQNLAEAIAWLGQAFGFREHYRYGEPISGAQLSVGAAWIMVTGAQPGFSSPAQVGYATQSLTIFVDDLESHYAQANSAGAKIVEEIHETIYGERQYAALDIEGHHWLFSHHARDVSPDEWGAILAGR